MTFADAFEKARKAEAQEASDKRRDLALSTAFGIRGMDATVDDVIGFADIFLDYLGIPGSDGYLARCGALKWAGLQHLAMRNADATVVVTAAEKYRSFLAGNPQGEATERGGSSPA